MTLLCVRQLRLPCFALLSNLVSCSESNSNQTPVEDFDPEGKPTASGGLKALGDNDIDLGSERGGAGDLPQSTSKPSLITELPDGFLGGFDISHIPLDANMPRLPGKGGWKLVGPLQSVDLENTSECANILRTVMRDFRESHSDFQTNTWLGNVQNIVTDRVGADQKPIFGDVEVEDFVKNADSFFGWYHNVSGVNKVFVVDLWLEPEGDKFVFESSAFFPLKEAGFALEECSMKPEACKGEQDGFHFTTEIHTRFEYSGGEIFKFNGDDDVWAYLNGKRAIDLGGVHQAFEREVHLDEIAQEFALEIGQSYDFDLFHAERNTARSTFRFETTLDFTGCGQILPGDVVVK